MTVRKSLERLGGKRPYKSFIIVLSAVYRHAQENFSFLGGSGETSDTAEFEEHDYLTKILEVHKTV